MLPLSFQLMRAKKKSLLKRQLTLESSLNLQLSNCNLIKTKIKKQNKQYSRLSCPYPECNFIFFSLYKQIQKRLYLLLKYFHICLRVFHAYMHGNTVFKKYNTGIGTMTLRGSIGCMQQTTQNKVSNLKAVYFPIITFLIQQHLWCSLMHSGG